MERDRLQIVREIAQKIRSWGEDVWACDSLSGFCAIGSLSLFKELRQRGFDAIFAYVGDDINATYQHCFVIVEGYLVDITATQFDCVTCKVIIIPEEMASTQEYWKDYKWSDDESDIEEYLSTWGDQNPFKFLCDRQITFSEAV